MQPYVVSARKYRPARFADMVGQEHISSTLRNAIKSGQLAHSFLFCGPRGVGKTTAARILAKTINCENVSAQQEACNECQSCLSFNKNASFNIHELDAASNNSVDDIRSLVDQVRFPPQSGKYKIYIIDEVHMLSSGAFNAFLKTLEEPPSYCKFILATTEKSKILPTILSRCQIFDFRRISIEVIVKHLRHIADIEKIEAEDDALHIIAQKADGGMRDALSMFDRLASFSGGKLTYVGVLENLNVLDYDYFFKATDGLLLENAAQVMVLFDEILKKGFEGDDFIIGLCEHFRNLLFCKDAQTVELMEVSEQLKQRYAEQASLALASFLVNCLQIGNQCDVQYKSSKNKRLLVELALLKMCYVNSVIEIAQEGGLKKKLTEADKPVVTTSQPTVPTSTATKPAESPIPSEPLKKSSKVLSLESLNAIEEQKKEVKHDAVNEPEQEFQTKGTIDLDETNLLDLWKEFAETIQEKQKGLYTLMNLYNPKLTEGAIEITLSSEIQKNQFEPHVAALKNYFKKRTNTIAEVLLKVNETTESIGTKYLSPQDKLKRLIELHPLLAEMQKRFGLELNFE